MSSSTVALSVSSAMEALNGKAEVIIKGNVRVWRTMHIVFHSERKYGMLVFDELFTK
jgi:hypothetical protein